MWYNILMAEESSQIVVTNVLKVEIFRMAIIDLYHRFCYRFVEPMPMIWQTDGRVTHMLTMVAVGNPVETFLMQKYKETIENSKHLVANAEDWAKIQWLENVDKVEIIECDIVPRSK